MHIHTHMQTQNLDKWKWQYCLPSEHYFCGFSPEKKSAEFTLLFRQKRTQTFCPTLQSVMPQSHSVTEILKLTAGNRRYGFEKINWFIVPLNPPFQQQIALTIIKWWLTYAVFLRSLVRLQGGLRVLGVVFFLLFFFVPGFSILSFNFTNFLIVFQINNFIFFSFVICSGIDVFLTRLTSPYDIMTHMLTVYRGWNLFGLTSLYLGQWCLEAV